MSAFKYKKPRNTAEGRQVGAFPVVFWDQQSIRNLNMMADEVPKRITEGMGYMALEAAGILKEAVQANAPVLHFADGAKIDYGRELTVELVTGMGQSDIGAAVVYRNKPRKMGEELLQGDSKGIGTVLYIIPKRGTGAPPWVTELRNWGPWPAHLLPAQPSQRHARVIARRVTPQEMTDVTDRLRINQPRVEQALRAGGLRGAQIRFDTKASDGLEVIDDISWSVLRAEFGYGGQAMLAWRPAIKRMQDSLRGLAVKWTQYIMSGKKSLWNLPAHGEVGDSELAKYGDEFQKKLAEATGGGE